MPNENTSYLSLPLPHPDNLLEGDVFRLRDALNGVDSYARQTDTELKKMGTGLAQKADSNAVNTALAGKADNAAVQTALNSKVNTTDMGAYLGPNYLTLPGGVGPFRVNIQDGTGRVNFLWNTLGGGAATYSAAEEDALRILFGTSGGAIQAFYAAGAGKRAGDIITWQELGFDPPPAWKAAVTAAQTTANEAKAAAQAAQGAIANVNPYKIGEFKSWFEQSPPAGWAVRNGAVLTNANTAYPDLWSYLHKSENVWKCKTLAQWNSLSSAAGGVGGVPYFVVDDAARTIKLPDTRGDYKRDAGSSFLQAVGDWHDSAIRNIIGRFGYSLQASAYSSGVFTTESGFSGAGGGGNWTFNTNVFNASSVVSTASDNRTRTYAILGCVYVRRT